jgi:hypothetical protein
MFLPSTSTLFSVSLLLFAGAAQVQAHVAPWTRGIWECTDGKNPVRLNALGDQVLICNGVCFVEQRRAF